ncbi:MAG: hypothetical protein RR100_12025 [Comamonas sp.]
MPRADVLRRCVYFGGFLSNLSIFGDFSKNIAACVHVACIGNTKAFQTLAAGAQAALLLKN